jgi:hypothetical protein
VKKRNNQIAARAMLLLVCGLLSGCRSPDDPRLQGTWKSNREATVAAAFAKDPRWTNATPEHIEQFKNLFGGLTLTYSNCSVRMQMPEYTLTYSNGLKRINVPAEDSLLRYHVVKLGQDFVVIRPDEGLEKSHNIRMRFVDNGNGYWTETFFRAGPEEKFDRVATEPGRQ